MTKQRQNYMKRANVLFSKLIRERDGHCLNCGTTQYLQCAHIIPRTYKSIRCDFGNAVALCRGCHVKFTHRPLEWREWVEDRFPGRWDRLHAEALTYTRVDWKQRLAELKEAAENMGIAA